MVTSTRTASRLMIIAQPNRSASWRSNQLVLLALAVPSLIIATGFALLLFVFIRKALANAAVGEDGERVRQIKGYLLGVVGIRR